ncbi:MAG: asparagine synthetase B [Candidatus Bathyarchaeota archaeon]|jgi:asparagine synthase (glutamine-hydrolysing)|nr:asparagine synthetase B [Candidatus Bathyarchaeota archaeon A05DMB-3]MDH7607296.1 asparagine synthetase B [Candidatus Bathyarchaeota archaeon]
MRAIVAVYDRKEKRAAQKTVEMLKALRHRGADAFGAATPKSIDLKAEPEQLQMRDAESKTAVGQVFLQVLPLDKPQPIKLENIASVFDGRIYQSPKLYSTEATVNMLAAGGESGAEALIGESDGSFACAVAEAERLIVGRDALGLYPLYYGGKDCVFAFASECKALWKIGVKEAKSFPPGHVMVVDGKNLTIKPVKVLKKRVVRPSPLSMEEAVEKLQGLLERSVREKTAGLDRVAVAFSGGLDSSLTAFLAKEAGAEVHLIHVSLENQLESVQAEEAASLLGLPFHKYLYSEKAVEHALPQVLWAVESPDPIKTSIGIPLYWTAERAAELGFRVLLVGQGADELFGGYKRYLTLYSRYGGAFVEKAMANDVLRMYENNFERDFKLCSFHNVELRLPFAAYPLVEFALNLPLKLKINSKSDMLRKIVLRKTAEKLGLPPKIVNKPKKAIQYATGVDKALKKLAKREKLPLKQYLQKTFQKLAKF